jgi:hypothetical protein
MPQMRPTPLAAFSTKRILSPGDSYAWNMHMDRANQFNLALQRVVPFMTELSDDFVIVVMDHEIKQPVSYLYGDPEVCHTLTLAAQFELEKILNEVRNSGSGGLSEEFD